MVKSLPAMQETLIQSLGQEDLPGEGNGHPLQYSCLENSMDRPESDSTEQLTHRGAAAGAPPVSCRARMKPGALGRFA